MTNEELHAIHAAAMSVPRPLSATEIGALRLAPGIVEIVRGRGFALVRLTPNEAEILTLAVDPSARRQGTGRALLEGCHTAARRNGAVRCLLDVAETNAAARALYGAAGYAIVGRRKGYYTEAQPPIDAILMAREL